VHSKRPPRNGAGRHMAHAKEFFEAGTAFIQANGGEAVEIEPGSRELAAWVAYFKWLGFCPWMLKLGRAASAITMPTADPCDFDPSYAAELAGRKSPPTRPARSVRPLPTERRWQPQVVQP
jgi:hypothetical protein